MVSNTVEATLRSRFEDGIARGIEQSQRILNHAMASIKAAGNDAAASFNRAWDSMADGSGRARDEMGRFVGSGEAGLERITRATRTAADGVGQSSSRMVRSLKTVAEEADRVAGAARSIALPVSAALTAGAVAAVKLASDMEVAEVGFKNMLGSAEKAKKFLGELQAFAAATPFQFNELRDTASKMLAMGFAARDIVPTLRAIGDAVSAVGGGQEKIERVRLALTQMMAKEKVSAEEMMQLAEAGIPAWQMLARAIGVSVPEAMKLAEKGSIDARGAVFALVQQMEQQFGGRMKDISGTLKGQWSNLIDNIEAAGTALGEKFLPLAKRAVEEANKLLEWAKKAADAFVALPTPIQNTAYALGALAIAAGPGSLLLSGLTKAAVSLLTIFGPLGALAGTARTVAFAIANNLTGALVGGEAALYAILRAIPPVGTALGLMWGGNKLLQHAQGNTHLNTTAENIKAINARLKETPQWFIEHGMAPPKVAGPSMDALLEGTKQFDKPSMPPLLRVDPAEAEKARKQLAEQLEKFAELRKAALSGANQDGKAALQDLFATWAKIDNELTLKGAEWDRKRAELKSMAVQVYEAKIVEIRQRSSKEQERLDDEADRIAAESQRNRLQAIATLEKTEIDYGQKREENERHFQEILAAAARKREEQRQKEVNDAVAAAQAIARAMALSREGRIDNSIGGDALKRAPDALREIENQISRLNRMKILTPEQIAELERLTIAAEDLKTANVPDWGRKLLPLHQQLLALNKIGMDPFHQTLNAMQNHIEQFGQQAAQAFAQFWTDMVTGQEGSGKRLLAAFLGIIGQMLIQTGSMLMSLGLAEVVAASTMWGKLLGFNAAAGWKAIATGAVLAAAGGALAGAASNLTQSGQGADTSSPQQVQQSSPQPQVQVINVGAAGRAQSPAEVKQPQVIELRLTMDDGIAVKQWKKAYKGNDTELRVMVQRG